LGATKNARIQLLERKETIECARRDLSHQTAPETVKRKV